MRLLIFGFCLFLLLVSFSLAVLLQFGEVVQVITQPEPLDPVFDRGLDEE